MYHLYVCIPEGTWKVLRMQHERKYAVVVSKISRKLAMDMLDSEIVVNDEENGCRFEDQGLNT